MKNKDFDFEKFGFTSERRYVILDREERSGRESVFDDNRLHFLDRTERGYTLPEAKDRLIDIAKSALDWDKYWRGYHWFDDESIVEERNDYKAFLEEATTDECHNEGVADEDIAAEVARRMSDPAIVEAISFNWYEGEGVYYGEDEFYGYECLFRCGDESYDSLKIIPVDEIERHCQSSYLASIAEPEEEQEDDDDDLE